MSEIDFMFCGGCKFNKSGSCKLETLTPCGLVPIKDCYYKQLQQLKANNKELRKENEKMYKMGCENFVAIDQAKRLYKLNKCLDEIEEYIETCNNTRYCKDCKFSETCQYRKGWSWREIILQKIKEVKNR